MKKYEKRISVELCLIKGKKCSQMILNLRIELIQELCYSDQLVTSYIGYTIKVGFRPNWAEMSIKSKKFVDKMNFYTTLKFKSFDTSKNSSKRKVKYE